MPKPDEEFKVNDWNWLSEHFEPSKAERMAKVAWSIARSTPEIIPQHSLKLDPFIVIPLCAQWKAQFIEKVLSAIEPSPCWQYLFSRLTPDLQFDLLYRLIKYRRPTEDDWRNLFREVKYEFKNSWHYRLVLVFALAMSMVTIAEIVQIIFRHPRNWSNGLLGLGILATNLRRDTLSKKGES